MPARLAAFSCFSGRPHYYDMPRKAIEEFKELYRLRYGVELTDAEAPRAGLARAILPVCRIYEPCAHTRTSVEML